DGIVKLNGDGGAGRGLRCVFSSSGLRVVYPGTSAWLSLSAEELYVRSFAKRRLPSEAEIEELLGDVSAITRALRAVGQAREGTLPVLLSPGLAMSFVGKFMVANLNGS